MSPTPSGTGAGASRPDGAASTEAACTRLLFDHAWLSLAVQLVVGALTAWLVVDAVPRPVLGGWLAALGLVSAARLALLLAHRRAAEPGAARWRHRFGAGAAGGGLAWGLGAVAMAPHVPGHSFALLLLPLAGLAAGAIATLGSVFRVYLAFTAGALGPVVAWLASRDAPPYPGLAALAAVYAAALLAVAGRHSRTVRAHLRAATDNERLSGEAARSLAHSEAANRSLREEARRREHAVEALRARDDRLRRILDASNDAIVVVEAGGQVAEWSRRAQTMFGWSRAEATGRDLAELLVAPHNRRRFERGLRAYRERGERGALNRHLRLTAVDRGGRRLPVEVWAVGLGGAHRDAFCLFVRDLTEQRRAERLYAWERRILEVMAANEPLARVLETLVRGIEAIAPGTLGSVLLLDAQRGVLLEGAAPSLPDAYNRQIDGLAIGPRVGSCGAAAHSGHPVIAPDTLTHPNWAPFRELAREFGLRACWSYPIRAADGRVLGTFALYHREPCSPTEWDREVLRRLTDLASIAIERAETDRALRYQAAHDALTGLINRHEFERRLEETLEEARRDGSRHALCYLDLDQFKVINDTCGHLAGDELLRRLGRRLGARVREGDVAARLGGDEFAVLLRRCSLADAERRAAEIRHLMQSFPFTWGEKRFRVGVSIGLVPVDAASADRDALLGAADAACYAAKEGSGGDVHLFRPDDAALEQRRSEMAWVSRIQHAIEEDRLRLFAQPIAALDPSARLGHHYELLLRLENEAGELVAPGRFLPAAERYGLSARIDRWVVSAALEWLAAHPRHLERLHLCSINLSGRSIGDAAFLRDLLRWLGRAGVPAQRICFEITETAAVHDLERARHFLEAVRERGCRIALDDFGSGMASFGYLRGLPVDLVKIDGQFVRNATADPVDRAMVRACHEVARIMGKQTIAEYVEDDAAVAMLRRLGVDFAQGYAIGRPRPLEEAAFEADRDSDAAD